MSEGSDLSGAGITAKERLEKIEAVLERIDTKLDAKADAAAVASLEVRVRDLELHGGEPGQQTKAAIADLWRAITDLRRQTAYAAGAAIVIVWIATRLSEQLFN